MRTVSVSGSTASRPLLSWSLWAARWRLSKDKRVKAVGAFAREVAVIGVLYALWELAGRIAGFSNKDAYATSAMDRTL